MIKKRFNIEMLKEIQKKDKCEIDYDNIEKLNSRVNINFICNCGVNYIKRFESLEKNGALCNKCATIKKNEKRKNTCLERYGVNTSLKINNNPINKRIMSIYNNNLQLLKEIQKRDNCIIKDNIDNINRDTDIGFICNCGNKNSKKFSCIKLTGLFCKECTRIKKIIKSKATCIERYGVDNPHKNIEFKLKIENTNLEKYGTKCSLGNKEVQKKAYDTMKKIYGDIHQSQSQTTKDKIKKTNLEKYGYEYAMQNKEVYAKVKKTFLEKYGVEYNTQNPEISEKQSKNSYKLKEFKFPSGEVINVQGYEPFLLKYLVEEKNYNFNDIIINRCDVPDIRYKKPDKIFESRYFCDMYIPKNNTIFEVKSNWTYKKDIEDIPLKIQACIDSGYNVELFVYDGKGVIDLHEEYKTNNIIKLDT